MTAWNEFLNDIKEAENELGNPREVWYRGHSDIEWELTPTLMRLDDWENRRNYLPNILKLPLIYSKKDLMTGNCYLTCNITGFQPDS